MEKPFYTKRIIEEHIPLDIASDELISFVDAAGYLRISKPAVTQAARMGSALGVELVTVYHTGKSRERYLMRSAVEAWKAARKAG